KIHISLLYVERINTLVQWIISPHNNGERAASGSDPGLIQWI
ncbi:MAG: hypothetical protein QG575_273, partial [Euryarchaeota archaeon]|nr:hypothetical protein [Euryarchaeota archaeon]